MVGEMFCPWLQGYEVRIRLIDEQHKLIFELISELHSLIVQGETEKAKACLSRLVREKKTHFATEEDMLRRCGYPGYSKQASDHALILKDMEIHLSRVEKGIEPLDEKLAQEVRDGVRAHILGPDQAYAEYLRIQGVR